MAILPEVKKHYGRLKILVNGQWKESRSETILEDRNPATDKVIAEFPIVTRDEALEAVKTASKAFETWKEVPMRERARLLFDMRGKFEEHFNRLTRILTQDHGRTINESVGSVRRVIENIESACSAIYSLANRNEYIDQLASGIDEYLVWEPLGPFLIITPGNIPMHAWSSFVPYALAAGCTVVISPSPQNPVAAQAICEVAQEAGLPPGVINLVYGDASINQAILTSPEIQGVGFIGSSRVGKELFELCGRLGKVSSINGNGKNHLVVMPDADLENCITWLLRSCFGMTGQRCLGVDNVVVVGEIYGEIKERFKEAAASMKMGYGLDESVNLGPLTTKQGRDRVVDWIERAVSEGGKIVLDGRNPNVSDYPHGYFLGPTILEDCHVDMSTSKEEAFGPVAALIRADNLDQVIGWINTKTNYGHSACILTSSGKQARKFIRGVKVGNVGVNVGIPQPYAFFPLGSKRESFMGSAKSRMASMRLFMDEKTVTARWV